LPAFTFNQPGLDVGLGPRCHRPVPVTIPRGEEQTQAGTGEKVGVKGGAGFGNG